jgi:RHS repeat-associated protein
MIWTFFDDSGTVPANFQGKLLSVTDAFGEVTTLQYDAASGKLLSLQQQAGEKSRRFDYVWFTGGDHDGKLESVKFSVDGQWVRRVVNEYYPSATPGGTLNDLKRVSVQGWDAAAAGWREIRQHFYRYYTAGESGGFLGGLKFIISPEGCARLAAAGIVSETASDAELAPYAAKFFVYDGQQRVVLEKVNGGANTYTYSYLSASVTPGFEQTNVWNTRTIETRPDGNTYTVYSNSAGAAMLTILKQTGTGRQWCEFYQFDTACRRTLHARPSAIASVTEPAGAGNALVVTLKTNAGLVWNHAYYTTTNPTTGAVAGYKEAQSVREGSAGTLQTLQKWRYATHAVGGQSIVKLSEFREFPNATTTDATAPLTKYLYAYYDSPGFGSIPIPPDNLGDVSADTVIEQVDQTVNGAGQVTQTAARQRLHDASGTGPLHGVTGLEPLARVSWLRAWFDGSGRRRYVADYGTNGGSVPAPAVEVPEGSDTVLVSQRRYAEDGGVGCVIDPEEQWTVTKRDAAGRIIQTIEGKGGKPGDDSGKLRTTSYTYSRDGLIERLLLDNPETGQQVTRWVYGSTLATSGVVRSDLLTAKLYPLDNPSAGVRDRTEFRYNRLGQVIWSQDGNNTVHEFEYDKLGRQTQDRVTAFGSGVDSTVKRLSASYDVRGLMEKATSHSHATVGMGAVLNEVALEYSKFNQLAKDRQAHGGAVDGSTPEVVYAYAPGTSRNTARRTAIIYPSGFQQTLEYDASVIDDRLSRVSGLKVSGETGWRVLYTYAGLGRLVQMLYPQVPGLSLNYQRINPTIEPPGDGGDPYVGYDRFGRTEDLRWVLGANNPLRLLYGYDRDSRRTWRKDVSTGGDIGTRQEDLAWNYDGLSQVTHAKRGALNINRTAIGGVPTQTEGFGYDETGNWLNYRVENDGVGTLEQTRKNDRDNRMVQVNGSAAGITYDQAGNMTQGPLNDSVLHHKLKWDAWNRLVEVRTAADAVVMTCGYDALFRRITKTAGGVTRHSYYSDRWKALEEYVDPGTGTQTLRRRWFWGARPGHRDELVFRDRDTTGDGTLDERLYCLMDYFSPAAIVNLSGTVLERYTFSAFGKRRVLSADYTARTNSLYDWEFGFQGQFLDLETWNGTGEQTGLYNYGYRYYVPALGRWPSRDPIMENSQTDLYSFVANKAVNVVDLLGAIETSDTTNLSPIYEAADGKRRHEFPNSGNCLRYACKDPHKQGEPEKVDPRAPGMKNSPFALTCALANSFLIQRGAVLKSGECKKCCYEVVLWVIKNKPTPDGGVVPQSWSYHVAAQGSDGNWYAYDPGHGPFRKFTPQEFNTEMNRFNNLHKDEDPKGDRFELCPALCVPKSGINVD